MTGDPGEGTPRCASAGSTGTGGVDGGTSGSTGVRTGGGPGTAFLRLPGRHFWHRSFLWRCPLLCDCGTSANVGSTALITAGSALGLSL